MTNSKRSIALAVSQPSRFRVEVTRDRDCRWHEYLIFDQGKLVAGGIVRGGPIAAKAEGLATARRMEAGGS